MDRSSHKIVVSRISETLDDNSAMNSEWRLFKKDGDHWLPCRRSDPADAAAFEQADVDDWLGMRSGEYLFHVGGA